MASTRIFSRHGVVMSSIMVTGDSEIKSLTVAAIKVENDLGVDKNASSFEMGEFSEEDYE